MHARTTTALAMAGTALAVPAAALAAQPADQPPAPTTTALRAPIAGNLTVAGQMRAVRAQRLRVQLSATATRLARRVAKARGVRFHRGRLRAQLGGEQPRQLRSRVRHLRTELVSAKRSRAGVGASATPAYLQAIAACESGGNPATDTGNGFYGKYQFTLQTWQSVGGSGNPAQASEAEQDRRAAMLYAQQGSSPWPVCGR